MDLSRIRSSTVALVVAAGVMFLVGKYTENAGFMYAGVILGVVVLITGFNQATSRRGSDGNDPK